VRSLLVLACALVACNQQGTPPPSPTAPADCAKVSAIVTMFELGPDAKSEIRNAAIDRHRDECTNAKLTVTEANCMAKAKNTWELMACAPAMFPQRASVGDCKAVGAKMRDVIAASMPKDVGSAGSAMVEKMMVVVEASCTEDSWPAEYRKCIIDAKLEELTGDSKKCEGLLSDKLRVKMGERLKPIVNPSAPPVAPATP